MKKRLIWLAVALMAAVPVIEAVDSFAATGKFGIARPAEARVGRPLTPISVAGAARRTVRRCAVGVYNC